MFWDSFVTLLLVAAGSLIGSCRGWPFTRPTPLRDAETDQPDVDVILHINRELLSASERSLLLEGDILRPSRLRTFAMKDPKWPKINGFVTVPYSLSESYDNATKNLVLEAFADFGASTCVRFVERKSQKDYISIVPLLGCYSNIGRVGGMQILSLSQKCFSVGKGPVLHELMHVLGFWHEHSRADRGRYIDIIWSEIMNGYLRDFCMYKTTNLIVSYDLLSILHYSRFAFSRTGAQTIVPKYPNKNAAIGQRIALSASDVLRVNKYYQCLEAGSQADVGDLDMDLPAVPDYTCTDGKVNIVPSEGPPYEITFIENADLRGPTVQSALPIGGPSVPSSMPVTMPTASTTILAEELTVTTTMPEKVSSVLTGMSLEGLVVRNSFPSNSFSKMAFFTARQGSNVTTAMAMVKYIASQSMQKSVISHKRSTQVPTVGNFEPQLAHTNPFPLSSLEVPISTTIYTLEDSVHAAATVEKFPVLMTAPTQGLLASSVGFSIPSATFKEGATNSVAANSDSHSIRRRAVGQHSSLRLPNTEVNNTLKALWALGGTYWPLEEPIAQNRKCVEHLSRNMVSEFSTIKDQGLKHFMVLGSCITKRESGQNRKFGHVRKHQRLHSSPHWKDQEFSSVRDKSDLFKVFPHKEDLTTSLESTKLPVYRLAAASVAPADHVRKRSPVVQRTVPHHAHPRRTRKLAGERLLPVPPTLFCNFEDGLCGWKLKQNAHSQRICRKERLIFGGPERHRDHPRINDSFPAGCYVSLKTSSDGHADGQRASLVSPLLRGIWCLSFWHKLHGSNTGSLNMYLHVVAPPEVWHWVLHLQKRSHWVYKEVPLLEKQNEDVFQVKLESAAGLAPGSWIDIDDLLLWRC